MLKTTFARETFLTHCHLDPKPLLHTLFTRLPETDQFYSCLLVFIFFLHALANSFGSLKNSDPLETLIQKVKLSCIDSARLVELFAYF